MQKTITLKLCKQNLDVHVLMHKSGITVQFQINNASCAETFKVGASKKKSPENLFEKFNKKAALEFVRAKVKTRFAQMKVTADQITI